MRERGAACTGKWRSLPPPSPKNLYGHILAPACDAIRNPRVSWNSFRQSNATLLGKVGESLKTAQAILGHSDLETTLLEPRPGSRPRTQSPPSREHRPYLLNTETISTTAKPPSKGTRTVSQFGHLNASTASKLSIPHGNGLPHFWQVEEGLSGSDSTASAGLLS
jgi:hypothetical protein